MTGWIGLSALIRLVGGNPRPLAWAGMAVRLWRGRRRPRCRLSRLCALRAKGPKPYQPGATPQEARTNHIPRAESPPHLRDVMNTRTVDAGHDPIRYAHASTSSGDGKSCCISPFLWVLRDSIFWVWAVMRSSRLVRQSAMRCCSGRVGGAMIWYSSSIGSRM